MSLRLCLRGAEGGGKQGLLSPFLWGRFAGRLKKPWGWTGLYKQEGKKASICREGPNKSHRETRGATTKVFFVGNVEPPVGPQPRLGSRAQVSVFRASPVADGEGNSMQESSWTVTVGSPSVLPVGRQAGSLCDPIHSSCLETQKGRVACLR